MTEPLYLGFDPGGDRKFGVSLLDGGRLKASVVSTVDQAIHFAAHNCGSRQPVAAGIDTLLHWATKKSGWRACDLKLRKAYPISKSSIVSANSLYGAMSIGGMALAIKLRQIWPDIQLNETHPKVLLHALGRDRYDSKKLPETIQWFVKSGRLDETTIRGEHAFDAALSAWATREGLEKGWPDITGPISDLIFPAGPAKYLWPSPI